MRDRVYTCKEFERITYNSDFKNTSGYQVIDKEDFEALRSYIESVDLSADSEAADFFKLSRIKGVGEVITCQNYVGLIRLRDGLQLQILPKVELNTESEKEAVANQEDTEKIFIDMLKCLKDFDYKTSGMANLNIRKLDIMEIFIRLYLDAVKLLVKHGLKSGYISQEENCKFWKGKLLINQNIKYNLAHKERFYVAYDEYMVNRPVNRIVKATLQKLAKMSNDVANSRDAKYLLTAFEEVEASTNYAKDFSQIKLDRSMGEYESLIDWSKVFLFDKSFTTFAGSNNAIALLYPMEKLFEAYVAKKMKQLYTDYRVSAQDRGFHLFEKPKIFSLRPDIVLRKGSTMSDEGEKVIVMDTKWKRLIDNPKNNYGISQSDMYQMYAYSKKYKATDIWVLYPYRAEMHKDLEFTTNDPDINTTIHIYFVDVKNIDKSLLDLKKKMEA